MLEDIIVPVSICVVLPIMAVWLVNRRKINEANRRTEIINAALEKNSDIDISKILESLSDSKKSIKQSLLKKLNIGLVCIFIGLALIILSVTNVITDMDLYVAGWIVALIGVALIITFFVSKKFLAKELKQEEEEMEAKRKELNK